MKSNINNNLYSFSGLNTMLAKAKLVNEYKQTGNKTIKCPLCIGAVTVKNLDGCNKAEFRCNVCGLNFIR